MKRKIFFTLLLLPLFIAGFAHSKESAIDFFYSSTCPHCAKEQAFLDDLEKRYPGLEINRYEVVADQKNKELLNYFYQKHDVPESDKGKVPVTFVDSKYFVGYNETVGANIENEIKGSSSSAWVISAPLFGNVDLSELSLPLATIVLGGLDGFNPCAMWILLLLLAILINMRSKKRIWLVGGTFILASGLVYYLILAAWLNLFLAVSYVNVVKIAIGVFAIVFGAWQIKNFIQYKPGVCKVTSGTDLQERIKDNLRFRAERLAGSPFTIAMILGVIALAIGVNLIEFVCSAGLPALYANLLAMQNLSGPGYYLYLLLYTFVFMLDDLVIFFLAAFALSKFNLSEKYSHWSLLIGGILIFLMGLLLIFKPELLTLAF